MLDTHIKASVSSGAGDDGEVGVRRTIKAVAKNKYRGWRSMESTKKYNSPAPISSSQRTNQKRVYLSISHDNPRFPALNTGLISNDSPHFPATRRRRLSIRCRRSRFVRRRLVVQLSAKFLFIAFRNPTNLLLFIRHNFQTIWTLYHFPA
uniref:Uncharacterized protein n=1 Tax=Timema poppense TaxID=170557 RepID=A0A7R9CLV1_TIMPO|nr:unnamed protein product [Timema poppensis]